MLFRSGDVVRRLRPGAVDAGDIVHIDGAVLGRHNGVIDYTVGQRRGLGVGGRAGVDEAEGPLYVIAIDAKKNQVIVGPRRALACTEVYLGEVNWISGIPEDGTSVLARLRNTAQAMPAHIFDVGVAGGSAMIKLEEPQFGIAAGQAAALYDGRYPDRLIGGGWIARAPCK